MRLAVVGAGWAGMAAAVAATRAGHEVTVFEAARHVGGRARALPVRQTDGTTAVLDNGQHIMIGAYAQTLALMREVGVDPARALLRLPLSLRFPDGGGLSLPRWPAPLDAAAGILRARGWSTRDKFSLVRATMQWRRGGFECGAAESVRQLCAGLTPRVLAELIDPLCVSALNTPAERSSARVFLRVFRDTLFTPGGSNLLLPRCDLGSLFPEPASRWLHARAAAVRTSERVHELTALKSGWLVAGESFDSVLLACPHREAARLAASSGRPVQAWLQLAGGLRDEAIATVYASGGERLPRPVLALRTGPDAPAQFVFDRSQLGGPAGLLAFVVSACGGDHGRLQRQVMAQARTLGWTSLQPVRTVVEKRATFACTPGLRRPPARVAPGLLACGDYVDGPYPATLEGAVRSALEAVAQLV